MTGFVPLFMQPCDTTNNLSMKPRDFPDHSVQLRTETQMAQPFLDWFNHMLRFSIHGPARSLGPVRLDRKFRVEFTPVCDGNLHAVCFVWICSIACTPTRTNRKHAVSFGSIKQALGPKFSTSAASKPRVICGIMSESITLAQKASATNCCWLVCTFASGTKIAQGILEPSKLQESCSKKAKKRIPESCGAWEKSFGA